MCRDRDGNPHGESECPRAEVLSLRSGKRGLELTKEEDVCVVGTIGRMLQEMIASGQTAGSSGQGEVTQSHENPPCIELRPMDPVRSYECWEDDDLDFVLPPPAIELDYSKADESEDEGEERAGIATAANPSKLSTSGTRAITNSLAAEKRCIEPGFEAQ